MNSRDKLSVTYNDKSILENFHVATAFGFLANEGMNIFESFENEEY
jgi:hypothetical protein